MTTTSSIITSNETTMDIQRILKLLPHRYPFLLIDKVLDLKIGQSLEAIKNITINEPIFTGHFPEKPVFPGVLIVEAMAQAAGVLSIRTHEELGYTDLNMEYLYLFAAINDVRFKRIVLPGDQLHLKVVVEKHRKNFGKFLVVASVNNDEACSATLTMIRKETPLPSKIHKTAVIDPKAQIGANVSIGAHTVIGADVIIDTGTEIGSNVVIQGPTRIGKHNKIFQFSSIGEAPQDVSYKGEPTRLEIGDHNVIREGCTIHRGTLKDQGLTKVGNHNLFMAYSHIAHDCVIGDHNILANNASLAGHVVMDNYAVIGAFCGIHQFCKIGSYCFISRAALVGKDIPPYLMVVGGNANIARVSGINVVGLERRGFTSETIQKLQQAYKILYREHLLLEEAIQKLRDFSQQCQDVQLLIDFIENSERGILRENKK